jgi:hypothetical protein
MKKAKLIALTLGAIIALASCVSAGFVDFVTAEPSAPLHPSVGIGIEGSSSVVLPDVFGTVRLGLLPGLDAGVRAGMGTALVDLKYTLPFGWERAALAIDLDGGTNFDLNVAQIGLPVVLDYRLIDGLRLTVSQTTAIYLGKYSGFTISGGIGLKWNIGKFYLFTKAVGGYLAPQGGEWSKPSSGNTLGYTIASEQPFGAIGLMMGFDF